MKASNYTLISNKVRFNAPALWSLMYISCTYKSRVLPGIVPAMVTWAEVTCEEMLSLWHLLPRESDTQSWKNSGSWYEWKEHGICALSSPLSLIAMRVAG